MSSFVLPQFGYINSSYAKLDAQPDRAGDNSIETCTCELLGLIKESIAEVINKLMR